MARRTQLQELVSMLRAESRRSSSVALGIDEEALLKAVLRRHQEILYDGYDWPFLRVMPKKPLAAGQRYYDMPTDLNFDRIEEVVVWFSGQPQPITRGIGFREYAQFDSDSDVRSSPAMAWDIRSTNDDTAEQIEIWPIPDSNDTFLQFQGIRKLNPLVSNSDRADLDDQLIVLFAAAELLANQKSQDAGAKLEAAKERHAQLKARSKGASPMVAIGQQGAYVKPMYKSIVRVR